MLGWRNILIERTSMFCLQERDERFQLEGLLAEIAGGTNQCEQVRNRNATDAAAERAVASEYGDGALHVGPTGILREDRADDNLEARSTGPPVLRAIAF